MTTSAWSSAMLVAAAALVAGRWPSRPSVLRSSDHRRRVSSTRSGSRGSSSTARRVAAAAAGGAVAIVVGGPAGWVLGSVVGVVVLRHLVRLGTREDARRRAVMRADLPLAADLLSAALAAGAPTASAAGAVGRGIGGPLGAELCRVARAYQLGASPSSAWGPLLSDPGSARLARPMVRAAERGSPAADASARVAAELRRAARDRAAATAEVVAVRGVGPLGLCFLPAFVLLGVVPLVAGSALVLLRH